MVSDQLDSRRNPIELSAPLKIKLAYASTGNSTASATIAITVYAIADEIVIYIEVHRARCSSGLDRRELVMEVNAASAELAMIVS